MTELFAGINNSPADINALIANVKFTQNTPDLVVYSNVFGVNPLNANFPDTLNHYGVKMYTYFVPPTTGNYKFYVRADDYAQFWMNTNALGSTYAVGATVIPTSANSPAAERAHNAIDCTYSLTYAVRTALMLVGPL